MLKELHLVNVGPADAVDLEFGERLNLITGDNGLGKTFLLDVAWWCLTGTWPELSARGRFDGGRNPRIRWSWLNRAGESRGNICSIEPGNRPDRWPGWPGSVPGSALVFYVRVGGGFALFDPLRNEPGREVGEPPSGDGEPREAGRGPRYEAVMHFPPVYLFNEKALWHGLGTNGYLGRRHCMGLLHDWVLWQSRPQETPFRAFERILEMVSSPGEEMRPGKDTERLTDTDALPIPTLSLPYGDIPILHASAGMKRIIGLAYLLTWAWTEHRAQAKSYGIEPRNRLVFLIDEVEAHLHPRWQRTILKSLLTAAAHVMEESDAKVEIVATTHSPLVLASAEPDFDPEKDKLFHCGIGEQDRKVRIEALPWAKQGDATNWLISEVFGLQQARSLDAEQAISAAEAFMRGGPQPTLNTKEKLHAELCRVLPGHDEFWPRWVVWREQHPQ